MSDCKNGISVGFNTYNDLIAGTDKIKSDIKSIRLLKKLSNIIDIDDSLFNTVKNSIENSVYNNLYDNITELPIIDTTTVLNTIELLKYVPVECYIRHDKDNDNYILIYDLYNTVNIDKTNITYFVNDDISKITKIDSSYSLLDNNEDDVINKYRLNIKHEFFKLETSLYELYNIDAESIYHAKINKDCFIYLSMIVPEILIDSLEALPNTSIILSKDYSLYTWVSDEFINDILDIDIENVNSHSVRKFINDVRKYFDILNNIDSIKDELIDFIYMYLNREWDNIDINKLIEYFPYLNNIENITDIKYRRILAVYRKDMFYTNIDNLSDPFKYDKAKLVTCISEKYNRITS